MPQAGLSYAAMAGSFSDAGKLGADALMSKSETPTAIHVASSLLLAVMTALMSFRYADVAKAIEEKEHGLPAEKRTLGKKIAPVFWSKALPLAVGATAIALVFLPRTIGILAEAMRLIGKDWNL